MTHHRISTLTPSQNYGLKVLTLALSALASLLSGCSTQTLSNPAAESAAYRDAKVLAETPTPPAPWEQDKSARTYAYQGDIGARVRSEWEAPKGTPLPFAELIAAGAKLGWTEFQRDATSLQLRRGGETTDYRLNKDGKRLTLERFAH